MDRKNLHHQWNLSHKRAAALQTELSKYVRLVPLTDEPRIIVGVDSAEWNDFVFIAVVVMDAESDKVIQITHAQGNARFGYIPGYRAFREGPFILKAVKAIDYEPDMFFFAGQGVCHPRFCGMASHLGLWLDKPAIGCTETRLVGHWEEPGTGRGDYSVIRYSPEAPGVVLRTRDGLNPVFVSPGHRIDLMGAIEQTLRFASKHRLPEPLRRAHIEAGHDMRRYRTQRAEARR